MDKNSFTEKDVEVVIDFLNHIAQKAELKHTVAESIQFIKLLNNIQTNILPKMKDHIFEIKQVIKKEDRGKL